MSLETSTSAGRKMGGFGWVLALIPLLLLGVVMAYLVVTGGGLSELSGPPIEQIKIERITLPEENVIKLEIINDGPQEVTIAQTLVDDAVWEYKILPSNTLARLARATVTIPYPWVDGEAHTVLLMSSLGTTFEGLIPVAVKTRKLSPVDSPSTARLNNRFTCSPWRWHRWYRPSESRRCSRLCIPCTTRSMSPNSSR